MDNREDANNCDNITEDPEILLPEKPTEPLESDCCGTGCSPCVFDIYKAQVLKWKKECQQIINGTIPESLTAQMEDASMNSFEYKEFEILDIFESKASSSKVFRVSCRPKLDAKDVIPMNAMLPISIGQHITLKSPNGKIARKYTVLRIDTTHFDIIVRIYSEGVMTQMLDKLSEGDHFSIRGPFGNKLCYKPNEYKCVVMLAAGSGIAAMYRIIETILNNENDETRVRLLYSNRSIDLILLKAEIKQWSSFWNFTAEHYISSRNENQQKSLERMPYGSKINFQKINVDVIKNSFGEESSHQDLYLVCGTTSFEKDMINYLTKIGVENKYIHVF